MRTFKVLVLFLIAFVFAWIILATFTQAPFKAPVSAVVLWYQTPPLPIFWYVAGAVFLGIAIGVLCMVSPLMNAWAQVKSARKRIKQLEEPAAISPSAPALQEPLASTEE